MISPEYSVKFVANPGRKRDRRVIVRRIAPLRRTKRHETRHEFEDGTVRSVRPLPGGFAGDRVRMYAWVEF